MTAHREHRVTGGRSICGTPGLEPRRRGPGSRADADHPTRHELLNAAASLADQAGLTGLTVARITAAAGCAKGTFYVHFPDRAAFLVALHRRTHDALFSQIAAATAPARRRFWSESIAPTNLLGPPWHQTPEPSL